MRIACVLILSCACCFGQKQSPVGLLDPAGLMMMNPVLYPTQVANLKVWLSADFGCYSNAGVNLCTNKTTVQQWSDQSGNGNNVGQSTAANRPRFFTNVINGLPAVGFDGGFERLTNLLPVMYPAPNTIFVVCQSSNTTAGKTVFAMGSNAVTHRVSMSQSGGPLYNFTYVNQASITTPVFPAMTWHVISYEVSTNSSRAYDMSKKVGTSTAATIAAYGMMRTVIGATEAEGAEFIGNVAEFIAFSSAISSTERYGIEMYLKRKYALPNPF